MPVADLGGGGGRTNPLKFPDFLGGWGRGFECTDTRSNQTGFHNTTDVSFICSKKNNQSNRRFRLVKRSILVQVLKNLKIPSSCCMIDKMYIMDGFI